MFEADRNAFLFVGGHLYSADFVRVAERERRDYNFIRDKFAQYTLKCSLASWDDFSYVPDRMTQKVKELSFSLMESGLYGFYWSYTYFLLGIGYAETLGYDMKAKHHDERFQKISMESFGFVFVFYLVSMGLATLVFFCELFWFSLAILSTKRRINNLM